MGAEQSRSENRAVIISNKKFDKLIERRGTERDVEKVRLALRQLGFSADIYKDNSKSEILKAIEHYAKHAAKESAAVVIIVMTHGGKGGTLYTKDHTTFSTSDVWRPFVGDEYKGKLKLFIFQACRGDLEEKRVFRVSFRSSVKIVPCLSPILPHCSDFLLAYSTIDYHTSFRDTNLGTWYIQNLCEEVTGLTKPTDIHIILTRVTNIVLQRTDSDKGFGQTPSLVSFVHKEFPVSLVEIQSPPPDGHNPQFSLPSTSTDGYNPSKPSHDMKTLQADGLPDASSCLLDYYPREKQQKVIIFYHFEGELKKLAGFLEAEYKKLGHKTELRILTNETDFNYLEKLPKGSELENVSGLTVVVFCSLCDTTCLNLQSEPQFDLGSCPVPVSKIWQPFTAKKCSQLHELPKCFFIFDLSDVKPDGDKTIAPVTKTHPVNNHSDFLILYGFGKEFYETFLINLSKTESRVGMLELIRNSMSYESSENKKRLSYFQSTLRYPVEIWKHDLSASYKNDSSDIPECTARYSPDEIVEAKVSHTSTDYAHYSNRKPPPISKLVKQKNVETTSNVEEDKIEDPSSVKLLENCPAVTCDIIEIQQHTTKCDAVHSLRQWTDRHWLCLISTIVAVIFATRTLKDEKNVQLTNDDFLIETFSVNDEEADYQMIENFRQQKGLNKNYKEIFSYACLHDYMSVVETIIDLDRVNINSALDDDGYTCLHHAVMNDSIKLVELLLSLGAKVDPRDEILDTPLMDAAFQGYLDIARVLLGHGADINLRNVNKFTALGQARRGQELEMFKFLKSMGGVE